MAHGRDDRAAVEELGERFTDMSVGGASRESIFQVMKAVEDAEHTIKLQLEENNRLKEELAQRTEELKQYKLDLSNSYKSNMDAARNEKSIIKDTHMLQVENDPDRSLWMDSSTGLDSVGTIVLHQNGRQKNDLAFQNNVAGQHYTDHSGNGFSKASYNPGNSQFSLPSSRSISPIGHQKGDFDAMANLSGQNQRQISELNSSNSQLKQDLILKIREHEEEILQLRRHLVDYSMKEAQLRNDKYVLEKRIAHMRMAFDQQQQELVDAASKALSYRQEIIEENIRLTYALQSAHQERSTFVSSLLPLLSEFEIQPQTADAHSIVSSLKILFRHLHEKLVMAEEKLKESHYQIAPWRSEASNNLNLAPQSSANTIGAVKNGLELVPQPAYSHVQSPIASPFNAQARTNLDASPHQAIQASSTHMFNSSKNMGTSPFNRIPGTDEMQTTITAQEEPRAGQLSPEGKEINVSFKDLSGNNMMDDSEEAAAEPVGEPSTRWGNNSSPYIAPGLDDPNVPYPYLPPLPEEHSSSFSEAAEDDPLPGVEGLQITGDGYYPGMELQACGYSINGTTSCNFEWVRYREDGSVNYIEGAKQPNYLITADDVDVYLSIQVQPLDDRKRKGELVEVFANGHRKIPCGPFIQERIERILSAGNASFEVSITAGVGDIWEHATLGIKAEGYSIKCNGPRGVVVTEKFSSNVEIFVSYEEPHEFVIQTSGGDQYLLRSTLRNLEHETERDIAVLTMRLFKKRVLEKRSKKKGRFFK